MPENLDIAKGAIVATLGPSSVKKDVLPEMINKGLDIVRLNLSHGTQSEHQKTFEFVRDIDDKIPILFDLSGPKIRIGEMKERIELKRGEEFMLYKKDFVGDKSKVSVSYKELINLTNVGNTLFLNDGLIELHVIDKTNEYLNCKVVNGGPLSSKKGLNAPGIPIGLFMPTKKDISDLEFSLDLEPDFYSVSFVRRIEDLQKVREIIATKTNENIPLISKIEHQDGVNNFDDILRYSDGVMVARGDLGVELPPQDVPLIQEKLVIKCNELGIPSIVATQMLESMMESPRPTRAEASDVANAIMQGTDAVMLSGETATGKYPIESVDIMNKIILAVQHKVTQKSTLSIHETKNVAESIGRAAVSLATSLSVDVIFAFTRSGKTSAMVSKFRPKQSIIAITPSEKTARRVKLQWGVSSIVLDRDFIDTDEMLYQGIKSAVEKNLIQDDAKVVIVAGSLLGLPSSTNLVHYINVKDIISSDEARARFAKAYSLYVNSKDD